MFVGRERELQKMDGIIRADRATIGVIYGRRRIGKSELIKKAFEKKRMLIFEGLENRPKRAQIDAFIIQLTYQTGHEVKKSNVKSWREAFMILYDYLKDNPAHLAFDEFQWMANYRHEIVADLKMVWDLYLSKIKGITLILCGSIASFMIKKVLKSKALYGRTDLEIHLKGFLLPETAEMLKNKGSIEVIEAQMMLGGVPKYLNLVMDQPSVHHAVGELAFTETGYLKGEYERIFTSHFGKRPEYERTINYLSKHPYGVFRKQVSEEIDVVPGGGLTEILNNLESAGFISSETPFHKSSNSRLLKYRLSDAYLRFYFAFIKPNLRKIESGIPKNMFGQINQTGLYFTWMGRAFEYLCMDHVSKISEILGFSGIEFTFGPFYESQTRETAGIQVDIVFDRKDNVITLIEAKYSRNPIGLSIIQEVERKVEVLKQKFKRKTIQRVLISQSEPTKELLASGYFYRFITPDELL
ncbi:MAG: hypothetical protein HOE30_11010 [Deltaproteobacteria bacterium]|nr:hypothetical protein [Deltaproteobacteria bacterium]MBT4637261.1 hypothetical protein [Deltaproteobacteria bacterium]MBT6498344.1 hypothetical protein [Deltaproteobacteria bacterium]MBT6611397.1 hypothetical protein [Deltaproteobacteria bacterium]MBT7153707.1 hypothetical protein [Deltaproteobacteria bacterium]